MRQAANFLATAIITAFLLLLVHALITLSSTEKLLRREIGESRIWITNESERAALQLLMALSSAFPDFPPDSGENNLQFRFDMLYSRVMLLDAGPQRSYLEAIGAAEPLNEALLILKRLDEKTDWTRLPPEMRQATEQDVRAIASVLRDLTAATSRHDRAARFAVRDQLSEALRLGVIAVLGVLITGSLMAALLVRNMRKLRLTQTELEHSHLLLEETVALRTQELREALDVERKAKAIYNSFIVTVAHQLRTPVAIINMIAQRQVREPPGKIPERLRQKFSRILQATGRLETLVNGFLSSAETSTDADPGSQRVLDFNTAVDGALQRLSLEAPDRAVTTDLSPEPLRVCGDPILLVQLIQILLSNAVKYSQPGTEITIRTRKEGQTIRCYVTDRGRGIPEEVKHSVFERWYRAPEVHHLPGMGLGLPVARAIIAQHRGVISFTSDSDRGTVFTISLPEAAAGDED